MCDTPEGLQFKWSAFFCDECLQRHPEMLVEEKAPAPVIPDAEARIYLYPTQENGRKTPIYPPFYSCPLKIEGIDDSYHDCRIYMHDVEEIAPGGSAIVSIKFLCPELFAYRLVIGQKFKINEHHFIGEGEFTKVLYKTP